MIKVNGYPVTMYSEDEVMLSIPQDTLRRHLELNPNNNHDFPVYLREKDITELIRYVLSNKPKESQRRIVEGYIAKLDGPVIARLAEQWGSERYTAAGITQKIEEAGKLCEFIRGELNKPD